MLKAAMALLMIVTLRDKRGSYNRAARRPFREEIVTLRDKRGSYNLLKAAM
ncbi:hypothetical protein HMPREF9123_0010, partial [Neisseria bacilliformis ATCC BAA-1200]